MLRKGASERVLYRMCTKTFTWRLLTGPELTEVYLNEMRRDFPAGELAGSCTLIENADLRQDGNDAVLTVTLADGPIHGRNFGDGYYRFTAETGYTGIADTGPYLRVTLNATNELFAGD